MSAQPVDTEITGSTGFTKDEVLALLRAAKDTHLPIEVVAAALTDAVPHPDTAPLTQAEQDVLAKHGAPMPVLSDDEWFTATVRARLSAAEQAETLTVDQAADLLHRDPSRIRHQVYERHLYGYKVGNRLRLPVWQFHDGAPLPHLRTVLAAFPRQVHPATVTGLMTTSSDELDGMSARQWLASGGPVEPVLALARTLTAW